MAEEKRVERFVDIAFRGLAPRNKARILWGIAFSMSPEERKEAEEALRMYHKQRHKRLIDLDAPQIMIDNELRVMETSKAMKALRRASR